MPRSSDAIVRLIGVTVAVLLVAWGVYLMVVGITWIGVTEQDGGPGRTFIEQVADARGWVPIIVGGVMLAGLLMRNAWLAWIAVALALVLGLLLVFSIGLILLGAGVIVAVATALSLGWPQVRRTTTAPSGQSRSA
jgi:hypothetical protein